jgi:type I restriction enzyme, S subunit
MTFPRYPAYKDSGVTWLGEVPEHWEVKRLKYNLQLLTEKTDRRSHAVALENIEGWTGRFLPTETEFEGDGVAFEQGDILFGKLRPYLAKAYLTESSGEAVGDFHVLRPTANVDGRFAQYQILNREFIALVDGSTFGSKMPRASWEFVAGMALPTPPKAEQTAIAAFLDRETAKIDDLIAEQRSLTALLKEKRQAVISHAVTKGLSTLPRHSRVGGNPDSTDTSNDEKALDSRLRGNDELVPMKDSGVAWLGEVPGHWEVLALKRISPSQTVGIVVNPSNYVADEGLPFLYGGDILEGRINFETARRISDEDSQRNGKTRLLKDDLVMVRVGAPGITAVVPSECEGGNCASVMLIRQGKFDSQWLCYTLNSRTVRYQVEIVQYGAAQEQFNISHAVEFLIPQPPIAEQKAISDFLNHQTTQIDTLITETEKTISLLQERRSALISAAVTGKMDVRMGNL